MMFRNILKKKDLNNPSDTIVFLVWVYPNDGVPEFFGIFSSVEIATSVAENYHEQFDRNLIQYSIHPIVVDYRKQNTPPKYWRLEEDGRTPDNQ